MKFNIPIKNKNYEKLIVGKWEHLNTDSDIKENDKITIEFDDHNNLTYYINSNDKIQKILLQYEIKGDVIVTDQPSSPRIEKTKFKFDDDHFTLVLYFENKKSLYKRIE